MTWIKLTIVFVAASLFWVGISIVLAFYGFWMQPVADTHQTFAQWAQTRLEEDNLGTAALVLVSKGAVDYEFYQAATADNEINRDTLFATASFSKFVAALGVMTLVEQGQVNLDEPVSRYLRRWQLPDGEHDPNQVTVRHLLSHTAGLTDGLGFGDYLPEETVPDIVASLEAPRASTGPRQIQLGQPPGELQYSGGGYLILELLIEDVSGTTFADYISQHVFKPLAMTRSTYNYLGDQHNHSLNYDNTGAVAPTYRYASAAATGLASSAGDLTRLVQGLTRMNPKRPIKHKTLEQMLEPHGSFAGAPIWGLGTMLYVQTASGRSVFGHDGANDPAINATLRINPDNADAIIVITSGAPLLASEIGSQWVLWQTGYPDFLMLEQTLISALVPILLGATIILLVLVWVGRRTAR